MEYNEFFDDIKSVFPERAIDLYESIDLLKAVIDETVKDIGEKSAEKIAERKFEDFGKLGCMAEFLNKYEKRLDTILEDLEMEPDVDHLSEEETNNVLPGYEKFVVDNKLEHSLYESFTHIRPYGFKIGNHDTIITMSWQRMFIKTCEYLFALDRAKFFAFENMPGMNGKKRRYFSRNREILRKAGSINDEIYIEMNMSGNSIRNLIVKMLREYRISVSDFKVFFRADYTDKK